MLDSSQLGTVERGSVLGVSKAEVRRTDTMASELSLVSPFPPISLGRGFQMNKIEVMMSVPLLHSSVLKTLLRDGKIMDQI